MRIRKKGKNKFIQLCLKCRKKYYKKRPEKYRQNRLMEGTVNKTQAMSIYILTSRELEAVPCTEKIGSYYKNKTYTYQYDEVFRHACRVHNRLAGLRAVSQQVDDVYLDEN
jgi:hypothetical protein